MKLNFDKRSMEYLKPVLRETRTLEESAEIIIPDTCPDGERVLYSCGNAFYRGKELSEENLTVAVGVSGWTLVRPEGRDEPELVEAYIPMSLHISSAVLHAGQNCRVHVSLKRLESSLVNPRKVMIRAVVSVSVWVYENEKEEHIVSCGDGSVQLLNETRALRRLVALEEKQYTVEDTVPFETENRVKTLCGGQIRITHREQRIAGSKVVLKGQADLTVVYITGDGLCATGTAVLGFSQYVDMGIYTEENEALLYTALGGLDMELSGDGAELHVSLRLTTCCELWCHQEMNCVRDIYSLVGQVEPETEARSYECLLDRQIFAPTASGTPEGMSGKVIDVCCMPGSSQIRRKGEQIQFVLPVKTQILCAGADGITDSHTVELELLASTVASENCRFEVQMEDLSASAAPGGFGVKLEGIMTVCTLGNTEFSEIVGGELSLSEQSFDGPGIVVRRWGQRDSLWNMAKMHQTTPEAIMTANCLEGEPVCGKMLLIPRSR